MVPSRPTGATSTSIVQDKPMVTCTGRQPLLTINDHKRDTGLLKSKSSLLTDFRKKFTVVIEHQAACVDHLEFTVTPVAILVSAITGHTWLVMDDRLPTAAETIDQRGLADVGAPDDRDDGTRQRSWMRGLS